MEFVLTPIRRQQRAHTRWETRCGLRRCRSGREESSLVTGRARSAADSFIGTDSTGAVGAQDQSYGAPGGHNFYVNDPGTNSTHAKLNIGGAGATFNVPVTVNGNLAVMSGSVTLPITGSSA